MILRGRGVHSGRECAVSIEHGEGPTRFCGVPLASLRVEGRERCSVAVVDREVMVVEHLLSAIVGASAFYNVIICVDGEELPLLDGGAASYFDALFGVGETGPPVVVSRAARFEAFGTTLILEPNAGTDIAIEVDFPAERFGRSIVGSARWNGDRDVYRTTIATARTFGATHELAALRANGLAAFVEPGTVVAIDRDDEWAPRDPEEPVRHKLLDVLGDLAPLGGPIRGRVRMIRPSHRGTRATLALAHDVFEQLGGSAGR